MTAGMTYYRNWVLRLVISHKRHGVRFVTGIGFWFLRFSDVTSETGGTTCFGHLVLHHGISHARQGVRAVVGIGFCILRYIHIYIYIDRVRDRLYEIFRTLVSASCDIIREIRGARWNGHWALHLIIYHARYGGYDLLQALCPASCDFTHETGATTFCDHWVLYLVIAQTRTGIDLSRALDSASCDNTRTHTHTR